MKLVLAMTWAAVLTLGEIRESREAVSVRTVEHPSPVKQEETKAGQCSYPGCSNSGYWCSKCWTYRCYTHLCHR